MQRVFAVDLVKNIKIGKNSIFLSNLPKLLSKFIQSCEWFWQFENLKIYLNQFSLNFSLKNTLNIYKNETLYELNYNASKCYPLFEVFNGIRLLFCGHIIQPMNGEFLQQKFKNGKAFKFYFQDYFSRHSSACFCGL